MKKQDLRSVIQSDFADKVATGQWPVHHVFEGIARRRKCEKYGFLVCIHPDVHEMCHENTSGGAALYYKQRCQIYYEKNIGGRSEFIKEFGKNYL